MGAPGSLCSRSTISTKPRADAPDNGFLTVQTRLIVSKPPRTLRPADLFVVSAIAAFHRSSVRRKMIAAVTGGILILFVIGHLLGNLQIFLGPEWINGYAEHLRDLGPFLWVIRAFLLVVVIVHIYYT